MDMKSKRYNNILRRAALTLAMALVALVPAMGADDIFAALAGMPQVESTYISGRFSHNKRYWQSRNGEHAFNISMGFSALYSYNCYSEESVKKARQILKDYIKRHPEMEVMMKTVQGMQEYVIYESFISDNVVSKVIIWSSDAPNVAEVVVIDWDEGMKRDEGSIRIIEGSYPGFDMDMAELEKGLQELKKGMAEYEKSMAEWGEMFGKDIASGVLESLGSLESLESLENLGNLGNLESLESLENLDSLSELKELTR